MDLSPLQLVVALVALLVLVCVLTLSGWLALELHDRLRRSRGDR